MKITCIVILAFGSLYAQGQAMLTKNFFGSMGIGFFCATPDPEALNNHPLIINGKIGKMISKNWALGLEVNSTAYREHVSGAASIQLVGSGIVYTKEGELKHRYLTIGVSFDRYLKVSKDLYFVLGLTAGYLNYKNVEKGSAYANNEVVYDYERHADYHYYAHAGINGNFHYFLNDRFVLTGRFVQLDCRFLKIHPADIYVEAPVVFGVQYNFNFSKAKKKNP